MTTSTGLTVPNKTPYLIRDDHKRLLKYIDSRREGNLNTNVLVKGPQGCGKSSLPNQYAANRELVIATLEIGLLSESSQIYGRTDLREGQTIYIPGLFTEAIQTPGCVVHLQELNRPESDKTLNAIFSVLDDQQRKIWVDEASRYIEVAPGVTFFATLNEGYEFIGTMPVDEALEDRFHIKVMLSYLPAKTEADLLIMRAMVSPPQAEEVVSIANSLRFNTQEAIHVSVRNTLEIASMLKFNMSIQEALRAVIALDDDKLETVLNAIHFSGYDTGTRVEQGYGLL